MMYKVEFDLDDGHGVQSSLVSLPGKNGDFRGAKHEELADLFTEYDISLKDAANALGISRKSLTRKILGHEGFSWKQVCILQAQFFPDMTKEAIMQETSPFTE